MEPKGPCADTAGTFVFHLMAHPHFFERRLVHQLLGEKQKREIGDFVIFRDDSGVISVLSKAVFARYGTETKTWKALRPHMEADKHRLLTNPPSAPISDDELEFIED